MHLNLELVHQEKGRQENALDRELVLIVVSCHLNMFLLIHLFCHEGQLGLILRQSLFFLFPWLIHTFVHENQGFLHPSVQCPERVPGRQLLCFFVLYPVLLIYHSLQLLRFPPSALVRCSAFSWSLFSLHHLDQETQKSLLYVQKKKCCQPRWFH